AWIWSVPAPDLLAVQPAGPAPGAVSGRLDSPRDGRGVSGAGMAGTALAPARPGMALLFDNDLVDLTVDAPQPDRAHAEEIAAAYAALTRGPGTIEEGFVPLYDGGGVERWATAG